MYIDQQLTKTGCGPIAITNALRWLGYPNDLPRKGNWPRPCFYELQKDFIQFGYRPMRGVQAWWVRVMLTYFGIPYERRTIKRIEELEEILDSGAAVVLDYMWELPTLRPVRQRGRHLIFVHGHKGTFLEACNINRNGAEYKPTMQKYIDKFGCFVWILRKPIRLENGTKVQCWHENSVIARSVKRWENKVWKRSLRAFKKDVSSYVQSDAFKRLRIQQLQRVPQRSISATKSR